MRDASCSFIVASGYNQAKPFSEGMAAVQEEAYGPWGFIDNEFKEVIPYKCTDVSPFYDGLARLTIDTAPINGATRYPNPVALFLCCQMEQKQQ